MSLQGEKTKALFDRAKAVIPHGVNSNFRYWGDDDTLVIPRGEGAYIWDADGKRYIDYRLGFGPVILGTRPGSHRRRYGIRLDTPVGDPGVRAHYKNVQGG